MNFVNTIITHITNGNSNEERLVNVMGGIVLETESERLLRVGKEAGLIEGLAEGHASGLIEGQIQEIIEMGTEFGLSDNAILEGLQARTGISAEEAARCFQTYRKA